MARQPNVVPFADGKPADNLEVEDIGNDEVLVGDPALDAMSERDERGRWRVTLARSH